MRKIEYRNYDGTLFRFNSLGNKYEFDISEPHNTADYIIFKDIDENVYAKDGKSGEIVAKDPNASDVVTSVLEMLESGTVYLKSGIYNFNGENVSLSNLSNIRIIGAGVGATKIINGGFVKNDSSETENIEIGHLTIDCNNTSNYAINLATNTKNVYLHHLQLLRTSDKFLLYWGQVENLIVDSVYFYDAGTASAADNAAGSQKTNSDTATIFTNCIFVKENSQGGAMLTTGSSGKLIFSNLAFVDLSDNSYAAISLESSFGDIDKVIMNNIFSTGKNQGIAVGNSSSHTIDTVQISNVSLTGGVQVLYTLNAELSNIYVYNSKYGVVLNTIEHAVLSNITIKNTNIYGSTYVYDKAGLYVENVENLSVTNLHVYDDQTSPTTPYGIRIKNTNLGGTYNFTNTQLTGPFTVTAIDLNNVGSISFKGGNLQSEGTATFSGDGSTTQFTIAHGLV
ncbi:MAG: hypothetical protein H0Z19_11770, partial [Archaeoglobus sp.]|uniref:right-handed parallel beta-helix repeat-containing protein n=1 Tax=Archaeoglobus sp. TaxID=1872626 RepID=UPI001DF69681